MPAIDITDELPHEIGPALTGTVTSVAVPADVRWDCEIGNLPFLFALSPQFPMQRETADFRRQRIDQERNPGEQSLDSGVWIRSQASWHYGQGLASAEPLEVSEAEAQFRFARSGGVDPWTPGQVTLLHDTEQVYASTGTSQFLLGVGTGALHADATTVTYVPSVGASAAVTWGGSVNAITSITSDGANWYVANAVGVYKGSLPDGAGSKIWDTGDDAVVRWLKSRLMLAVGPSLYELTASAGPTLPTELFTHLNSEWVWSDMAEGPTAIYAAGYSGDQSSIYRIGVDSSASAITLSTPVVVADMPRGEAVHSLYSYLGSFLVVGTSAGARVAGIASDGSLSLGPLVVESSDGCLDAVADGSFVYVTMGSKGDAGDRTSRPGLFRIDLSTVLNDSVLDFATAADMVTPTDLTGLCSQVTAVGDKIWFTVTGTGGGVFAQADTYVSSGWMETGRIRMGTMEPKAWRDIRLLGESDMTGIVAVSASITDVTSPSEWASVVQVDGTSTDERGSLTAVSPTPQASLFVAFNLSTDDTSGTPVLTGYQVRAIPAPRRTELLRVPLMLFDWEVDRSGARYGAAGGAWSRFQALKDLEASVSTVSWRDFTTGERAEAYVEQVAWTRTSPPSRTQNGPGGVCVVLLRLV